MPLVFIHGVNVRRSKGYRTRVGLRRRMFNAVVIKPLQAKFPDLNAADEIYWGDHGAKYLWNLRSVSPTKLLEDLGAVDQEVVAFDVSNHTDLLKVLMKVTSDQPEGSGQLESLGAGDDKLLVAAASKSPQAAVAAVLDGERRSLMDEVALEDSPSTPEADENEGKKAEEEGERIADLLLAIGATKNDADLAESMAAAASDDAALNVVHGAIQSNYKDSGGAPALEGLGAGDWLADKLRAIGNGVKRTVEIARRPKESLLRTITLTVVAKGKGPVLDKAKFFLGDILEYAIRGNADDAELSEGVEQALKDVAQQRTDANPLIVVTHSFGSAIFYDLVTSGRFDGPVDLWVTVGAQVSFLAEMRFFQTSPDPHVTPAGDPENNRLGRPDTISSWINVYDPADVLSFVFEPVFDGVTDIKMKDGANLANAHSAYFGSEDFYLAIRRALEDGP